MIIDWSKIKMAHGLNGSHIPKAIKQLCSYNPEEREKAYWELDNYIIVQGRLYEAAYYCIDELIESLQKEQYESNTETLDLLVEISLGRSLPEDFITDENEKLIELEIACKTKLKKFIPFLLSIELNDNICKESLRELIEIINSYV